MLALLFIAASVSVMGVESVVTEQTILQTFFNGDSQLYSDLIERQFQRLDSDKVPSEPSNSHVFETVFLICHVW